MLIAWINEISARVMGLFRRKRGDQELNAELREHFEMLVDENRAKGMSEAEARRVARIRLGGVEQIREAHREQRGLPLLETLAKDLHYGFRQLMRSPGFTLVAVLTIALGIGMNAGIFSILDALALQPIVVGGQKLASVYPIFHGQRKRNVHNSPNMFSYPEYTAYRDQNHTFSGLAAYVPFVLAISGGERPVEIAGSLASCNYFDVLNERPALGRGFVEADCAAAGASAVAVVSDEFWRSTLGADPLIIGKPIMLNQSAFTIVGVAPRGFGGTEITPSAFWAPIQMQAALIPDRDYLSDANLSWIAILGMVKPEFSLEQARADLAVITSRLDTAYPGTMQLEMRRAALFNRPEERGVIFTVGAVVLCAVGLVLLIACANIASLLLARAEGRRREIAVRLALGASRGRLMLQLLTESLLLAFIGGALGTFISMTSFDALVRFVAAHLPAEAPRIALHLAPDVRVLAFSFSLTVLTGIAFGLAPAQQSSRADVNTSLKEESGDAAGHSWRIGKLRNVLVITQVAVCMILLLAAGLLLHGLYRAQTIDPGFEMKGIDAVTFGLARQGYSDAQAAALHRQMKERLASLPGVDAVAEAQNVPLGDEHWETSGRLPGSAGGIQLRYNRVSPNFFAMLGIPIVRGRDFTDSEVQTSAHVLIVTESAARQFWPGLDPIGKSLQVFGEGKPLLEVIGVAKDVQVDQLGVAHSNFVYLPASLKEESQDEFLVHSILGVAASIAEIHSAIHELDPQLSFAAGRLEDNLENFRLTSRIVAAASGTLGALALLLASIGVYGLVSFAVSRRIREIGIRMALGADGRDVVKLIVGQALRPVAIGGVIGMVCCAAVSRIFSSLLFGVSPMDPLAFLLVPAFLILAAGLACYVPARRAMGVDPMVALRYE
jgi:macrolide transport system ATP-binding/permease protein